MRIDKIIVLVLLAIVVVAALSGVSYQSIMTKRDARRFPQKGRSVVLGSAFGRTTLNLNCTGSDNPTVIMDSGFGFPGLEWYLVQPEVAKFTRACSYDRAGYGWSSAGLMPRTSAEIAKELHALLTASTENPPYVLVGHSSGGYNIRVFAGTNPPEVSGLVFELWSQIPEMKLLAKLGILIASVLVCDLA